MRTPISDLKPGPVSQTFLLAQAETPKTKTGKPYFRGMLRDTTGSITAINFDPSPGLLAMQPGQIVTVRGSYSVDAKYGPQMKVNGMAGSVEGEYDIADFAESCPNDMVWVDTVYSTLLSVMEDQSLATLISDAFAEHGRLRDWKTQTAATTMHQAYRYGLYEHSVQVADIAHYGTTTWCKEADGDVVIAASLLHDIGKIVEYDDPMTRQLTTVGKLFGNTTLSYVMARDLFRESGELVGKVFDRELVYGILHAILAHHGKKEWGSPVEPQTIEALLVHQADQFSSRIGGFQRLRKDAVQNGQGEWTAYDRMFGSALWLGSGTDPEGDA
jgi:3'-5' exoribonuclease